MKLKTLVAAGLVAFTCYSPISSSAADKSVEERLADMEQRILYLEQRLADQGKVIVEKDRMIGKLSEQQNEMQGSGAEWPESIEITGLVEVEGGYADPYEGDSETDAVVATVELGVAAQVHDWVSGEILFLFEEDENDDNIDVDTATLTIAPPDGPWFVTGGRMYLPFGVYETRMVSDPLTLELGEIRETAVMFGFEGENLYGSAFLYNGDNSEDDDNRIDNFGAVLGYAMGGDGMEFGLDVAYINDIGDTDTLQDAVAGNLEAAGAAAFDAAIAGAREMARRTALDNFSVRTEDEYRDDARRNLTYGDFRAAFYANNSRATWAPATIYKDVDANGDETYVTSNPSKSACSDMVTTDCQVDIAYPSTVQDLTSLDLIYTANEEDDDIGKYYDALRVYAVGIDADAETATPEDKSLKTAYERLEATVASGGVEALTVAEATRDEAVETAGEDAAAATAEELGEPEPETYTDTVSGIAASARWRYGDVALMAEYLGATERFQSTALAYGGSIVDGKFINRGAKPSSWMVEVAYDFMIGSRPATIAVGYQGTDDAIGLELPKTRFMLAGSIELMDSVALAVEWAHDEDYDTDEWSDCALVDGGDVACAFGGTDENAETVTVQLAAEF